MQQITELAEENDTPVPDTILNDLRSRKKIVYLHTDQDLCTNPSEWGPYLHSAVKLDGNAPYYCAYIANPKAYDIQSEKIVSYDTYLKTRN